MLRLNYPVCMAPPPPELTSADLAQRLAPRLATAGHTPLYLQLDQALTDAIQTGERSRPSRSWPLDWA
jgi:hypothetical protein